MVIGDWRLMGFSICDCRLPIDAVPIHVRPPQLSELADRTPDVSDTNIMPETVVERLVWLRLCRAALPAIGGELERFEKVTILLQTRGGACGRIERSVKPQLEPDGEFAKREIP